MIFKIKIMCDGDRVLNCWDDKIAICRVNGDVDIFQVKIGGDNLPTLSEDVWRITHGNNTIEITDKSTKQKGKVKNSKDSKNNSSGITNRSKSSSLVDSEDDEDFVISIRPKKG